MQSSKKSRKSASTFKSMKGDLEDNIEFIKISIKKESDRKYRLKHLLEKYSAICASQKKHVKQIKAALIELKDAPLTPKIKMIPDLSIFVDNSMKEETRQFLCALLNTFYTAYSENQKNNDKVDQLNSYISHLVKGISHDEDRILIVQKTQINEQVHLEGELLAEKNRLKEELTKKREVDQAFAVVQKRFNSENQKHQMKVNKVRQLERELQDMKEQSQALAGIILQKQNVRKDCHDKVAEQLRYQKKLEQELDAVAIKLKKQKKMQKNGIKNLCEESIKNIATKQQRIVGEQTQDQFKFNTKMEFKTFRA